MERYLSDKEIAKFPLGKKYKKNSRGGRIYFVRLGVRNKKNRQVIVEFSNEKDRWGLKRDERRRAYDKGVDQFVLSGLVKDLNSLAGKRRVKLHPTKKDYKKMYLSYPDADELGYYKIKSPEYVRVRNILASVKHGALVYDVGCNSGGIGRILIEKKDCRVSGSELCSTLADKASRKGLEVFCGWAEKTPFASNYFDVVIFDFILEHVISPEKILTESLRTLKKEGQVIGHVPTEFGDWGRDTIGQHPEHLRVLGVEGLKKLLERFKLKKIIIKKEKLVGRKVSDYYFFKAIK